MNKLRFESRTASSSTMFVGGPICITGTLRKKRNWADSTENEARVHIDKRGRMVIPLRFRRVRGIEDGDRLVFSFEDGEVIMRKLDCKSKRRGQRVSKHVTLRPVR